MMGGKGKYLRGCKYSCGCAGLCAGKVYLYGAVLVWTPTDLDRLSLPRPGRAERVTSAMEVHGRRQRQHAAVGERRHHEPAVVAL